MCNPIYHESPPTLLQSGVLHRPDPSKPGLISDPQALQEIQAGISEIQNQADLTSLSGWIYYDPLLRFLHTIGPQKLALIKSLKLSGIVILHICRWDLCKVKCSDDLVTSLHLYIPIIVALLPNLEKLAIYAAKDNYQEENLQPRDPTTIEERLLPLLTNEIRSITSLKALEVLDEGGEKHPFAESTVLWFAERAAKRAHEKFVVGIAEREAAMIRQHNVHYGFCGEGHVWAECYNLCNFCGGFGHFRKTCPAVTS